MARNRGNSSRGDLGWPGVVMAVIAALLLVSAWNTGENLLYIVLGGVLSLLVLSGVLARANVAGLTFERETPHAVFRGDTFLVHATIRNHKHFLPSVSVRIEDGTQPGETAAYALKIPARSAVQLDVEHEALRRGVMMLPEYTVASAFPFGFSERRRALRDAHEVLVYPRVRAVRTAAVEHTPGARFMPRNRSNDGDEYMSLREYVPGDDVRLIAWRISARVGTWMIREMGMGNVRSVVFFLDTARAPHLPDFDERFEEAVELAASIAVTLLSRQFSVGIVADDAQLPLGKGTQQERRILELLARVQPDDGDHEARLAAEARRLQGEPVHLVCVSADPRKWGHGTGPEGMRVLDPGDVIHA
jgi:uncharacterized protein (DUF58 family)